tara:strand:+ start:35 stop:652 length:618 start_codon:yes stop_codon:yes gene_type:complete
MNIGILSYGCGNIYSFINSCNNLNLPNFVITESNEFTKASHIILPGVGSFDDVIMKLKNSGLLNTLEKFVHNYEIPFLGVCSGMQVLFESSEEGQQKGLSWLSGNAKKFSVTKPDNKPLKIPHIGWNKVISKEGGFFDFCNNEEFYFLHSFYCIPSSHKESILDSYYGINFTSAIKNKNILATQFHPEKSHNSGMKLLNKFSNLS